MHTRSYIAVGALLLAALGCQDDTTAPTESAPTTPQATVAAVVALALYQVSAGQWHTCGVTMGGRAYCWGWNAAGQLGDGTTTRRLTPVPVKTGLLFRSVTAGSNQTCAITTDDRAYCWGFNLSGQLGDGTTTQRLTPVPVKGGFYFREVSTSSYHTCGLTPAGRAYCWGQNYYGELGVGTTTGPELCSGYFPCSTKPVPVKGGFYFRQVSAGLNHTCGRTSANRALCWGSNQSGQIGDSTQPGIRPSPVRVAGGRYYRELSAGAAHTCAVTTGFRAFCWGNGRQGQIGNGRTYLSFWPRAVAGGLSFERVTAGDVHTCGETTLNLAYCWGLNYSGQLGDGTTTQRLTPVPVKGGLSFSQLEAGNSFDGHTCGRTPAGKAYCWGDNYTG